MVLILTEFSLCLISLRICLNVQDSEYLKPKHIEGLKHYCDGLIVGSAIVNQIAEGSTNDEKVEKVGASTKV